MRLRQRDREAGAFKERRGDEGVTESSLQRRVETRRDEEGTEKQPARKKASAL